MTRAARHLAPQRVALDEGASLLAREVRVPRLLDAAEAFALGALEADDLGGQLAVGIEAQALLEEAQRRLA